MLGEGILTYFDPMLSERCDRYFGRTTVEACGSCKQMPEVKGGFEVCEFSITTIIKIPGRS